MNKTPLILSLITAVCCLWTACSGLDNLYAHKISLVWNPSNDTYYMFYCAVDKENRRGIGLITSKALDP